MEFIVSEIDIMSGGSNSLKPGQPRRTNINTVQTLLKAKLGSTKEKAPKKGCYLMTQTIVLNLICHDWTIYKRTLRK